MTPPEKVTIPWLVQNVGVSVWVSFASVIIAAFGLGVTAGQTTFVKELFNKKPEPLLQSQASGSAETKDSPPAAAPKKDSATRTDEPNATSPKMSEPTPRQIMAELDKVPPLQQEDVGRHYQDIKVDWELVFSYASPRDNGYVLVLLDTAENSGILGVRCAVKLSEYRELGVINRGKRMRVTGRIGRVESGVIDLKDV